MNPATLFVTMFLAAGPHIDAIALPDGAGGIGFDDLRYSPELHRVVVPAGRTGRVNLIDPRTRGVEAIAGFSSTRPGARGHTEGTTSADAGEGVLFALDRTRRSVTAVDARTRKVVTEATLAGAPDYVRWVAPLHEVWVTDLDKMVIETFRYATGSERKLTRTGTISVPDGPESLEIDAGRRRAYANTRHDSTVAIDLDARAVVSQWENGCKDARGLAFDPGRGFVFVGCAEGTVVVLDPARNGDVVARASTGKGVDVIAFSARLSHLYVPAAGAGNLTVLGVRDGGALQVLGTFPTAPDAHCVTSDDAGNVYVCDPGRGRLLVFRDSFSPPQ